MPSKKSKPALSPEEIARDKRIATIACNPEFRVIGQRIVEYFAKAANEGTGDTVGFGKKQFDELAILVAHWFEPTVAQLEAQHETIRRLVKCYIEQAEYFRAEERCPESRERAAQRLEEVLGMMGGKQWI